MSTVVPEADSLDSVNNPRHPFGLPLGTVRGFLSLLICGFFWMVLLWPGEQPPKALLTHFFMLVPVILLFSPYSKGDEPESAGARFLPWLFRLLCLAGSAAVVALVAVQHPDRLHTRLTPDPEEVKTWWSTLLIVTTLAFLFGQAARRVLGRDNPGFQILRAWLSLLGMLLLVAELGFWVLVSSAETKPDIHVWQAFDLAFIAAYFGTRA